MPEQPHGVFLSYAHADAGLARQIAQSLQEYGYSVWWDDAIEVGRNYHKAIEDELRRAGAVVVLWSHNSVRSDFVLAEASLARDLGKLVPILVEPVELPLVFRVIETADLGDWRPDSRHPGFQALCAALDSLLAKPAPPELAASPPKPRPRMRKPLMAIRWFALASVALISVVTVSLAWRIPAAVEIEAVVSSVKLRSVGPDAQNVLEPVGVRSLALLGIEEITLPPAGVEIADMRRWNLKDDSFPGDAWTPLSESGPFVLKPADRMRRADITVRPIQPSSFTFQIRPVEADDLTLESPESGVLSLTLGGRHSGHVTLPNELRLDLTNCARSASSLPPLPESAVLRVRLAPDNRLLDYSSLSNITFQVAMSGMSSYNVLPKEGLAVDRIRFEELSGSGVVRTTLQDAGVIRYTDHLVEPVKLTASDFLIVEDLQGFRIASCVLLKDKLTMKVEGTAGQLKSGRAGHLRDRRPVVFDRIWKNDRLVALSTIVGSFLTVAFAVRKLIAELSAGPQTL